MEDDVGEYGIPTAGEQSREGIFEGDTQCLRSPWVSVSSNHHQNTIKGLREEKKGGGRRHTIRQPRRNQRLHHLERPRPSRRW